MNCSLTLQWNKHPFKFGRNSVFAQIKRLKRCGIGCEHQSAIKGLSITRSSYHTNAHSVGYKQTFSFLRSSRTYTSLTKNTFQCKSNGKKASSLGAMNNDAPLTKIQADDLILRLTEDERKALLSALQEYNSNQVKAEYEGMNHFFYIYLKFISLSLLGIICNEYTF